MKLVQVNHAFDPGLSSPQVLLDRYHTLTGWSDALHDAGCSVGVVQAYHEDGVVHRRGVDYIFCRTSGPDATRPLLDATRACEPDIVHLNGFDAPDLVGAMCRAMPPHVPVVVQDHGGVRIRAWSPRAIAACRSLRLADGFLFTSRDQAEPWLRRGAIRDPAAVYPVLEASTRMVPMDRQLARTRTGIEGSPAVLWVGRLDSNKDPLTVLAGFERVLGEWPDASLTMVFSGDVLLADVTRRIVRSARLRDRVRLAGSLPHAGLAAWYSAADLFVIGSHMESAGYALIEACACGTVPVVTDIAPFRAICGDGAIGHHWRAGDAMSCARALCHGAACATAHDRRRVRDHFRSRLSWQAVGARARIIYDVVCSRRRRAGGPIPA